MNKILNGFDALRKKIIGNHKKIFEFFQNTFNDDWGFQFYTLD